MFGCGLEDGEALSRFRGGGGVEAEQGVAGKQGGDGGERVEDGEDFIIEAASLDAGDVATGDG